MLVQGLPGIGKTALVEHFLRELEGAGEALCLRARCYERERVPFKGFDGIVDDLSRQLAQLDPSETAMLLPADAPLLAEMFPVLERVPALGALRSADEGEDGDPGERRQRAFRALGGVLGALGASRRLVLFIDDLQWSDAETLALLRAIFARAGAPRALLMLTRRDPEEREPGADLASLRAALPSDTRTLSLRGLSDADALLMLGRAALARDALPSARAGEILRQAQGHPLLIQELALRLAGAAEDEGARLDLKAILLQRVALLEQDARAVIEALALAGAPLSAPQIARTMALPSARVHDVLRQLCGAKFACGAPGKDGEAYVPFHDRVRECVSEALPSERAFALHRALAEALRPDASRWPIARRMVAHLLSCGDREGAAAGALEAARAADEQLAFEAAAELYRLALEHGQHAAERRRELEQAAADAYWNAGLGPEAAAHYLQAAELTHGLSRLSHRRAAAEALLLTGRMAEGLEISQAVLAEVGARHANSRSAALLSILWSRLILRLRGLRFEPRDAAQVSPEEQLKLAAYQLVAFDQVMMDPARAGRFQLAYLLLAMRLGQPARVLVLLAQSRELELACACAVVVAAAADDGAEVPGSVLDVFAVDLLAESALGVAQDAERMA